MGKFREIREAAMQMAAAIFGRRARVVRRSLEFRADGSVNRRRTESL
jgi:hypothetical protein